MKVSDMVACIQATPLNGETADSIDISTVYCCDLLSRVMTGASKDCVWITVLTHMNIIAVAQLAEIGAILIPEDVPVPEATIEKAKEQGINLYTTPLGCYEAAWKLHDEIGA